VRSRFLPQNPKGLGDVIHHYAQPVAKVIDRVVGTNVQSCGGCRRRREVLNQAIPIHPGKPDPAD